MKLPKAGAVASGSGKLALALQHGAPKMGPDDEDSDDSSDEGGAADDGVPGKKATKSMFAKLQARTQKLMKKARNAWEKVRSAQKILHADDEMTRTRIAWRDTLHKVLRPPRSPDEPPDLENHIMSNFGTGMHYFDLNIHEQWRLCFELLKLGEAESREANWVTIKEVRYSLSPQGEKEFYNLPKFWMVDGHGPPHYGYLSFIYDLPLGKFDTFKRRRKYCWKNTNRKMLEQDPKDGD